MAQARLYDNRANRDAMLLALAPASLPTARHYRHTGFPAHLDLRDIAGGHCRLGHPSGSGTMSGVVNGRIRAWALVGSMAHWIHRAATVSNRHSVSLIGALTCVAGLSARWTLHNSTNSEREYRFRLELRLSYCSFPF